MTSFIITKNESLKDGHVVIECELSLEKVLAEENKAMKAFQERIVIDGFRKGRIPEKVLKEKVGELAIFEEAASLAFEKQYEDIISEAKIDPIGPPKVSITKISLNNPVGFKIDTAVMPILSLSNYKEISKKILAEKSPITVEEKEIETALEDMRRSIAHHEKHHSVPPKEEVGAHEDHTGKDIPLDELPPLNDDFAKKLGNFESLEVLRGKIKENLLNEKTLRARERTRLSIIEKIIETTTPIQVPEVLIENELLKIMGEFRSNIERMGVAYDEYLVHIKKGEDELRKEWKSEAEKRSKIQLVLTHIARIEKIETDEEEVRKEVDGILKQHKDAKKQRVESYVRNILLNEKVWKFLEEQE